MTNKQLIEKYPEIFKDINPMNLEIPKGWVNLVGDLCEVLQLSINQNPNKNPQIVCTQMKEKFGELRFYVKSRTDYQKGQIDFSTFLSTLTCEVCGNPGKTKSYNHWLKTLCEKHENN